MHGVVVSASQHMETIRAFTVKECLLRWYLNVEAVKYTVCVVGPLKLRICIEVMLYSQVLHEVVWIPKVPHLDVQVVSTRQVWLVCILNELCTRDRVDNLREWIIS